MRKITLNLYEQELPPQDINNLWVDIDENTGDIKAIHRYNKKKSKWEPYLVSVNYLTSESKEGESLLPQLSELIISRNFKTYIIMPAKAKTKAKRPQPMSPKAGLTKNRYKCGGKLRKPKK